MEVPASTAWPLAVAFGVSLGFAALVTDPALAVVGAVVGIVAAVGWARDVIPRERHVEVPLAAEAEALRPSGPAARAPAPGEAQHRMRLPSEVVPYLAGVRGGLAGAVAMAAVALVYGLLAQGSLWYPINLLAAVALPSLASADLEQLRAFHALAFGVATLLHAGVSVLVGLLYVVLLPALPGPPWLWGVAVAPLLWTGGLHLSLGIVNPALDARIDWRWFLASQLAFGLACGLRVMRSGRVRVRQRLPVEERLGLEVGGREGPS